MKPSLNFNHKVYSGRIFILPVFFFMAFTSYSQTTNKDISQLWFHSLDNHPDFSSSYNYYIHRDQQDFMWISSTTGLNRFDGIRFKQYHSDQEDSTALFDDDIQSPFFEDKNQNLWFSTGSCIQSYQRGSDDFKSYFKQIGPEQKTSESCKAFFLERDTFLWFKADHEIYRYNIYQPESTLDFIDTCFAQNILVDTTRDGQVKYLYGSGDISTCNFKYWEIENGQLIRKKNWFDASLTTMPEISINDIHTSNDQSWVGTNKGLILWNREKKTWDIIDDDERGNCFFTPYKKNRLLLWGGLRGFQFFDKNKGTFHSVKIKNLDNTIIPAGEIANINIDHQNHIWISYMNGGLAYSNPSKSKFKSSSIEPTSKGNTDYAYTCFFTDRKGNSYYGTQTQGLFFKDKNRNKFIQFKNNSKSKSKIQIPNNWVTDIQEDKSGKLWVSTRSGLALFDTKNSVFKKIPNQENETEQDLLDLILLQNGDVLVCSDEHGVYKIIEKNNSHQLLNILAPTASFSSIFEDSYNNIYIGRNDIDISVFKIKSDTLLFNYTLPFKGHITGYHEQTDNKKLWISSFLGLAKVDITNERIDTIFKSESIQNRSIHSMLGDEKDNLWLGTPKGLIFFNSENLSFQNFTLSDGTQSKKFNLNAAIKMQDGTLLFGGDQGITKIQTKGLTVSDYAPIVQITDIKINDEAANDLICHSTKTSNVSQIKNITREYKDNTLSFEFVGIDYSDPLSVQLRYKLKGEDEQWVLLKKGEQGFTRYSNLQDKTYQFLVQSTNADGVWGPIQKKLEITILSPIYRRWWFILLAALLLASIIYGAYKYRINQIKEKAALKTRAAENKMTALRAQMNPHFIFNSLQTLNGLIIRKEVKGSIEYVSEFAKLMRMILENSRVAFISLEKEIELLELYLKIESRRFSIPFTYQIMVGQEVDTYEFEIPSMLLQPFVENAIKHGLFHKKEKGQIDIIFNKENNLLKCTIEDNGVGRNKSKILNNQKGREHTSRGLQIIEERLEIVKKTYPGNYNIQIIDLFDRDKKPSGTRIEVFLPIIQ